MSDIANLENFELDKAEPASVTRENCHITQPEKKND